MLLLLVAIVCAWLAVQTNRARRQAAAVKAIQKAGGSVRYDFQPSDIQKALESVNAAARGRPQPTYANEPDRPRWLGRLLGDEYFQRVVEVSFHYTDVGEPTLVHITSLPDLEELYLMHTNISDSDLEAIGELRNLRLLIVLDNPISNAGLVHLYSLHQLEQLNVINTAVTPVGAARLQEHLPNCTIHLEEPQTGNGRDQGTRFVDPSRNKRLRLMGDEEVRWQKD